MDSSRNLSLIDALRKQAHQFFSANFEPWSDQVNFRHPSLPNLSRNPHGVCTHNGLVRMACGNALTQLTEMVIHHIVMANTTNDQILLLITTGACESELSTMRSPLRQIRALHLMISPAGLCLHWKTHVHGVICSPFALSLRTSVHAPLDSNCFISFNAVANQPFKLLWSRMA